MGEIGGENVHDVVQDSAEQCGGGVTSCQRMNRDPNRLFSLAHTMDDCTFQERFFWSHFSNKFRPPVSACPLSTLSLRPSPHSSYKTLPVPPPFLTVASPTLPPTTPVPTSFFFKSKLGFFSATDAYSYPNPHSTHTLGQQHVERY